MTEGEKTRCDNCGIEIPQEDCLTKNGQTLCEDCYIDSSNRIQGCDPWAVRAAKEFEKTSGTKTEDALNPQQKAIYDLVKEKGRIAPEELCLTLQITPKELENLIAILRHCELVRGEKVGDEVYITLF